MSVDQNMMDRFNLNDVVAGPLHRKVVLRLGEEIRAKHEAQDYVPLTLRITDISAENFYLYLGVSEWVARRRRAVMLQHMDEKERTA